MQGKIDWHRKQCNINHCRSQTQRMGALHLTQQTEGAVVAVSSEQVAAVPGELVQDPIKCVNVVSPKKTAPLGDACDARCERKN